MDVHGHAGERISLEPIGAANWVFLTVWNCDVDSRNVYVMSTVEMSAEEAGRLHDRVAAKVACHTEPQPEPDPTAFPHFPAPSGYRRVVQPGAVAFVAAETRVFVFYAKQLGNAHARFLAEPALLQATIGTIQSAGFSSKGVPRRVEEPRNDRRPVWAVDGDSPDGPGRLLLTVWYCPEGDHSFVGIFVGDEGASVSDVAGALGMARCSAD